MEQTTATACRVKPWQVCAWPPGHACGCDVDEAVRGVMKLGSIPQGYMGKVACDRPAVRAWWAEGAPQNAWWFGFSSAVGAYYRRGRRQL